MSTRRAPILVAVLALVPLACSALVDFGGLSGGGAGPPDASSSSSSGGSSSSSSSGGSGSSSSSASSSSGGDGGGDASVPLDCTGALLCDDFEGAMNPLWSVHASAGVGIALVDSVRPRTGARSLHAARTGDGGRGYFQATLSTSYVRCEADVWAESLSGEVAEVMTVQWPDRPGYTNVEPAYVFVTPTGMELGAVGEPPDGGTKIGTAATGIIAGGGANRWIHITLHVEDGATKLTYKPDGAPAGEIEINTLPIPPSSKVNVFVGMVYTRGAAKPVAFVDNVRCVQP